MHSNPSNYDGKCSYLTDPRIVVCTFNCSHSMWISLENWGAAVGCSPGKIASPWWTFSIRGPFSISNVFCFFFFTWLATTCMENLINRNPMTHQYRPPHQLYLRAVQFKGKPPLQKQKKKNEKKTLKKPCHFLCSYILGSAFLFYFFFRPIFQRFYSSGWSRFSGESQEAFWVVIATQLTRHFTCRIRVLAAIFALIALYFASLFRNGNLPCIYTHTYVYMCVCAWAYIATLGTHRAVNAVRSTVRIYTRPVSGVAKDHPFSVLRPPIRIPVSDPFAIPLLQSAPLLHWAHFFGHGHGGRQEVDTLGNLVS